MTEFEKIDLKVLIQEVISEHNRAVEARHPDPGPHEYVDDTGHNWFSYTVSKGSFLQKLAALVTAIILLAGIVNTGLQKLVVEPAIHQYVDQAIESHEISAAKQMESFKPNLVTRDEFTAYVVEKGEKWRQQEMFNERIEATLVEIQKDIKEILKRTR